MKKKRKIISREKNKDTGFAILLILAWWFFRSGDIRAVQASVVVILVTLVVPSVLTPITLVLHGFSAIMGNVLSRVLLTVVFFAVVTPVGIVRRLVTGERLKTGLWKKGRESVFDSREKAFSATDLEHLF